MTAISCGTNEHVLDHECYPPNGKKFESLPTLDGKNLNVTITNATVMINSAKLLRNEWFRQHRQWDQGIATNGFVYIIDGVLMPPAAPEVYIVA